MSSLLSHGTKIPRAPQASGDAFVTNLACVPVESEAEIYKLLTKVRLHALSCRLVSL